MQNFFQKNDKSNSEFFNLLELVCHGLIYISEADAPVLPFMGKPVEIVTAENILQQAGLQGDAKIEERDFDELFTKLTTHKDWHREAETERAKKYLELKKLLEENLSDRKVFRIGSRRIDIYVVGIDKDGNLVGVTTTAVET